MALQEQEIATTQREFDLNEFFRPFERTPVKIGQQNISCYEARFGIETGELVPYAAIPLVARVGKRPDLLKRYPDSDNQPILTIEDDRAEPFFYRNFLCNSLAAFKTSFNPEAITVLENLHVRVAIPQDITYWARPSREALEHGRVLFHTFKERAKNPGPLKVVPVDMRPNTVHGITMDFYYPLPPVNNGVIVSFINNIEAQNNIQAA